MDARKDELQQLVGRQLIFKDIAKDFILAHTDHAEFISEEQKEHFQIFDELDAPIIVDGKDLVFYRAECHGLERILNVFHRGANILYRKENKLYIPQRSPDKDLYPSCADFSVGEHVKPRETYEEAAIRGAFEELGQTIQKADLKLIGKRPVSDKYQDEQVMYFLLDYAGGEIVHSDEIASGRWHSIKDMKNQGYFDALNVRQDHRPVMEEFLRNI